MVYHGDTERTEKRGNGIHREDGLVGAALAAARGPLAVSAKPLTATGEAELRREPGQARPLPHLSIVVQTFFLPP